MIKKDYENNKYYKKISEILKINNSKDIVTHLMIHFNKYLADYLYSKNIGIYRHYHNLNSHSHARIKNVDDDTTSELKKVNIQRRSCFTFQISKPIHRDIVCCTIMIKNMPKMPEKTFLFQMTCIYRHLHQ